MRTCIAVVAAAAILRASAVPSDTDAALTAFLNAASSHDAEKAAQRLIKDRVEFDTAWIRLKQGRVYAKAPTGRRFERQVINGLSFENTIDVPDDYDPSHPAIVRVQLHGGIGRPEPQDPRTLRENRIAGEPQIYLLPQG